MLTMDKVQAAILDWDYFAVVKGGTAQMKMMRPVPTTFSSAAAYAETFKSLLLEELRASAQQVRLPQPSLQTAACCESPLPAIQRLQGDARLNLCFRSHLAVGHSDGGH